MDQENTPPTVLFELDREILLDVVLNVVYWLTWMTVELNQAITYSLCKKTHI